MGAFLARAWAVIVQTLKTIGAVMAGEAVADGVSTGVKLAVRSAVALAILVAWGTFLGVITTWLAGESLVSLVHSNPFAGAPAGSVYLAQQFFPLSFATGLMCSYLLFRFTLVHAAIVASRVVKFLYGA